MESPIASMPEWLRDSKVPMFLCISCDHFHPTHDAITGKDLCLAPCPTTGGYSTFSAFLYRSGVVYTFGILDDTGSSIPLEVLSWTS